MTKRTCTTTIIVLMQLLVGGAIFNIAVAWAQPFARSKERQIGWGNGTSTHEWE